MNPHHPIFNFFIELDHNRWIVVCYHSDRQRVILFDIRDDVIASKRGQTQKEKEPEQEYILIPLCTTDPLISQGPKDSEGDAVMKLTKVNENEDSDKSGKHDQDARSKSERLNQREMQTEHTNNTNGINIVSTPVSTTVSTANAFEEHLFERFSLFKIAFTLPPVPNVFLMDNTGIFGNAYDDEDMEEEVDMNNIISSYSVLDTSFTKFHNDHPEDQLMHDKFQMSSIREISFFLGLQVKQKRDGIFINQDKYVAEILKKFDFASVKTTSTPMETNKALIKDKEAEDVDVRLYRSMIRSLMYLTSSRPDIIFVVCACARDSPFDLEGFSDSDYAGASLDKKSTTGVNEASIRRDLKLEDVEGSPCLPNATIFEELTRIGAKTNAWNEFSSTMASAIICLANNQKFNFSKYIFDSMVKNVENVNKFWMYPRFVLVFVNQQLGDMSKHKKTFVNPSLTKKLFGNMKREGTGFSGKVTPLFDTMMVQAFEKKKQKSKRKQRKEAEVAQDETEHKESVPTPSNDPLPSGEDSMQLNNLMVLCTKLQKQVLDLEKAKSDQAIEIASLKKRVEKLEKRRKFRTTRLQRLKKVGTPSRLESSNGSLDEDLMFDARVLDGDEMFMDVTTGEKEEQRTKIDEVTTAGVEDGDAPMIPVSNATTIEETLAQTLMEIKAAKSKSITTATNTSPKAKGIVFHDQEKQVSVSKPTVSVTQPSIKDKGKCIMQEPKRPLKKKDQVALDEQMTRELEAQLQAELIEEERKERQKEEEANIALIESWENTQVMMEVDRLLAERLQTREREDNEKKVEGSEEKVKGSRKKILGRKRAGKEQQQESSKRQRMEDDKESDEDEEVEIDDEADLKKAFMIVEYKLLKEGIMVHYQLIRADGSSKRYSSMIRMLQGIDKEYLQTLWKLVKIKHGDSRPEDEHERVLWGDLKVMFEPDIKSDVWRNLQGYKVTIWKLFDSCGVYFVRFGNIYSLGSTDVHNTFHVSNLKKCLFDESLVIPMKELRLDDKLNFVKEPVEIMDQEVKQLRQSRIPIVKVRWNSKRGPEFTWEREDEIHAKYPHLFSNITSKSN
ncbi:uncharacterized mitochondrial protein-like protein [Tanacetum coccineum]